MSVDSLLGWLGSRVSAINHMCRVQICESVNGPLHETIKYHFNLTERHIERVTRAGGRCEEFAMLPSGDIV